MDESDHGSREFHPVRPPRLNPDEIYGCRAEAGADVTESSLHHRYGRGHGKLPNMLLR